MYSAIRECAKLQKKKHANEDNEKSELPDYNSEDFVEFLYNKRMMLEKALNKPTNEQESVKLTTNISKGAGIKNTTLTPEKSKAVNSNVSDTNNGNDPNNQGLSNIIRKMKTIKSSTPPPRYKQQSSVKPVRTPEKQALRGLSNSNTPDLLSAKSENQQTTPVRYNKARTFKKYKSNGNGPRNEKTTKIHSFFKQTKEDLSLKRSLHRETLLVWFEQNSWPPRYYPEN
nr:hypothetical protein MACL_00002746 [Theileria orientalis]